MTRDSDRPPADLRACELEVAGVELVVISYPIEQPPDLVRDTALTRSEAEVAEMAVQGMSNVEIGARRGTSERTVANQMGSILRKLGLASRRELAVGYVSGALSAAPMRDGDGR